MAFTIPNIGAVTYPALAKLTQTDWDIVAAAVAGTAYVVSGCAVTAQVAPDGTVAVSAGIVGANGGGVVVTAGNVNVLTGAGSTAAHATLDRIDLIWADVLTGALGVTAGTSGTRGSSVQAGTVLLPAMPAGKAVLAAVYVPATATTIASTAANIVDKRGLDPKSTALRTAMVGSRLMDFGHSITAAGGATRADRGFVEILSGMLQSEAVHHARGGAVLAWHNRGGAGGWADTVTTGDGGLGYLLNMLKPHSATNVPIKWKGLYSAGTTYYWGEGVWDGSGFWWTVVAASGSVVGVTPVEGANWHKITGPTDYGATKWLPMQQLTILGYGNNDLGWGKLLDVYLEALRVALCRALSSRIFEATDPTCSYSGTWTAANSNDPAGGIYLHSSSQVKTVGGTAGNYVEIKVPPDFAGGEIDLGFLTASVSAGRVTVTVDSAAPGAGKMYFAGTDSGATGIINFSNTAHGYSAAGASQWSGMVVRLTGLASGGHTIRVTVTSGEAVAWLYFDYWSVLTPPPMTPPVLVGNLAKVLDYTVWTTPYPTDADVDTWNAGIAAMLAAEFPTAVMYDIGTGKDSDNLTFDGVHPNDKGHARIAKQILAAVQGVVVSSDMVSYLTRERHVGKSSGPLFISGGNIGIPSGSWVGPIVLRAYVRARPGDQLLLQLIASWLQVPAGMARYCDFATLDPTLLTMVNYASSGGPTQATNGIAGLFNVSAAGVYFPAAPGVVPYVVQESDVTRGLVMIQPILKSVYLGSGTNTATEYLLGASPNQAIVNVINLGQPSPYRSWPL